MRPIPLTSEQSHPVFHLEDYLRELRVENNDNNVDSKCREAQQNQILRVAEFLFGNTLLTAALALIDSQDSMFTQVSTLHRRIWLVQGSGSSSYMCFACDSNTPNLYFCGCRSFMDKTTKNTHGLPELCKHLLALKLIPVLGIQCPQLHVSDGEFASLVLDRTTSSY